MASLGRTRATQSASWRTPRLSPGPCLKLARLSLTAPSGSETRSRDRKLVMVRLEAGLQRPVRGTSLSRRARRVSSVSVGRALRRPSERLTSETPRGQTATASLLVPRPAPALPQREGVAGGALIAPLGAGRCPTAREECGVSAPSGIDVTSFRLEETDIPGLVVALSQRLWKLAA
jgi:hypothetical protein